ncbi:MAG: transcriptional regulator [Gammaproteobacteria bacterium]|nr:transcriptional regulator [Gammaproteobacteria bacterium]MAW48974.1 transcriptional regulator [Gammaproteobacteria bacterium]|tara:strand:- start:8817 stop:9035 length:219 start_codon:yes stop_codon:yes gene_type:complete
MPIYEYQCESCGHQFDIIQKVSDDKLKICPKCNEPKLKKLVTAAGFKLKGTGWYETDFKTKEKKSSEKKLKT